MLGDGAGAEMRVFLGTAVFCGMIGVTVFGIFLTPVFYYVIMYRRAPTRMRPAKRRLLGQTPLLVLFREASGASFWQRPRHPSTFLGRPAPTMWRSVFWRRRQGSQSGRRNSWFLSNCLLTGTTVRGLPYREFRGFLSWCQGTKRFEFRSAVAQFRHGFDRGPAAALAGRLELPAGGRKPAPAVRRSSKRSSNCRTRRGSRRAVLAAQTSCTLA